MPIDWNDKLAFLLQGFPDRVFGHQRRAGSLHEMLLGGRQPPDPERQKLIASHIARATEWLLLASDRPALPADSSDRSLSLSWPEHPEITHPVSACRMSLSGIDPSASRDVWGAVVDEIATAHGKDARHQYLWCWRFLPERLTQYPGGLGASWARIPADGGCPDHTVWQHMSMVSALATCLPAPAFLMFDVGIDEGFLGNATDLPEMRAAAGILSWLGWMAARVIVEELGPDTVLHPCLRTQPLFDQWLAEQGVTLSSGERGAPATDLALFPSQLLAILPAAQAEDLGRRCAAATVEAWQKLACSAWEHLAGKSVQSDDGARARWEAQVAAACEPRWVVVALEDDSTGAGALLAGRDIAVFEKALRQRKDPVGFEQRGKGVFFALWHDATRAALDARKNSLACLPHDTGEPCSCCAESAAVAVAVKSRQKAASGLQSNRGVNADPKPMCAPCTIRRSVLSMPEHAALLGGSSLPSSLVLATRPIQRKLRDQASTLWTRLGEATAVPASTVEQAAAELLFEGESLQIAKPHEMKARQVVEEIWSTIGRRPSSLRAVLVAAGDNLGAICRGGLDAKEGATLRSILHSDLPAQLLRTRSRWKDILDSPVLGGPLREAFIGEALGQYALESVPSIVREGDGEIVASANGALVAAAPAWQAFDIAHKLRERFRQPFVDRDDGAAAGRGLVAHLGPAATMTVAIAIADCREPTSTLLRRCRRTLEGMGQDSSARDMLFVSLYPRRGREYLLAYRWQDLGDRLHVVARELADMPEPSRWVAELVAVEAALTNPELDRTKGSSRLELVRAAVVRGRRGRAGADPERVAEAILALIDGQCVVQNGSEGSHALDGVHVARFLSEGMR